MPDKKQTSHRPPPGLRDGNPHGELRPHCVRLFQERHHRHRSRQDDESAGSGNRSSTKAALHRMSRGMKKAVMPGSMTAG